MKNGAHRNGARTGSAASTAEPATAVGSPGRPRLATLVYLAFTVLCWAGNWPLMKLVVGDIAPFSFAALRLVGAAVAIGLALALRRAPLVPERGERLALAWTGVLQIGCLFSLNMIGLQFVPPGRASVLVYTMPLWATLLGLWLARERPGRMALWGGLVGIVGLAIFFDPRLVDWSDGHVLLGNGMLILSAMMWALGAVLYRRRRWQSGFWAQVFWQLLGAAAPVVGIAVVFEGGASIRWTGILVFTLAFNWLIGTGIAYWSWAKALTDLSAAAAGQVVMLVPVLAFAYSALFMGEPVTLTVLAGVALILAGAVLTLRGERR